MKPEELLSETYASAMSKASGKEQIVSSLPCDARRALDVVIDNAERSKGVLAVIMTSATYKCLHPNQDIRKHQQSIDGGYSGRTFDSKYVTPFLKDNKFPSMAESGWLTRSLEQKVPYDKNYTGAITPRQLKAAFLASIDFIENAGRSREVLDYLLQGLIILRDSHQIRLARPASLPINSIVSLLDAHFEAKYSSDGASRLPVLAIYAVYMCIVHEMKRFENKKLMPIEKHTSSDERSGRIGDVEVSNEDGTVFEGVEIKSGIAISHQILQVAKDKILPTTAQRYYILSTRPIIEADKDRIEADISQVKATHGCQIVVNGVLQTLKYYLRLLDDTGSFIGHYVDLMASDTSIKYEHKQKWNELIATIK